MAVETFTHRGETWKRIPREFQEKWIVSVDLGQVSDPTAICIIHWKRTPIDEWTIKKAASRNCANITEQQVETTFDVVHLERLPLDLDYVSQAEYIGSLLDRHPLKHIQPKPMLIIDQTGVGAGVGDILVRQGMNPLRLTITAGFEATKGKGPRHWHVPKGILISGLTAALHSGELRFAEALKDAPAMKDELQNFQRNTTASGRATWAARTNKHDDLVLAVAMAVWRANGGGGGDIQVGHYSGVCS